MATQPSLLKRVGTSLALSPAGAPTVAAGAFASRNDSNYVLNQRLKNTGAGAISGAGTGAGIGTAIAPGIGTAIGAGIGAIVGGVGGFFLTDAEKEEMIGKYRSGQLDDQTLAQIEGTIARRYNILRRQQGADLSRRGIDNSSIAGRQIADTYNAERGELARAVTGEVGRRQAIGFGLSDQAAQQRAGQVQSGIGAAFQGYQLHQQNQLAQQELAADERLAGMIGKYLEGGGGSASTPTVGMNAPSIAKSQAGAGGVFSRQRTRMPGAKSPFLPPNQTLDEIFGRVK